MGHAFEQKVPADLRKALSETKEITSLWENLTPIARRDFITWIEGAKQLETRKRRIGIARDKLLKGDRRPCCYAVVPMNVYKALGENPQAKAVWKTLTPDERRDTIATINEEQEPRARALKIQKVCNMLAAKKSKN